MRKQQQDQRQPAYSGYSRPESIKEIKIKGCTPWEWLLFGKQLGDDEVVLCNEKRTSMDPGTLTHYCAKIVKKAGLPRTRFHDLRHTFATIMLKAGIHPKIVSEMLGYSSGSFTLVTYSHVVPTMQRAAMKRLDEVLDSELRYIDVSKTFAADIDKEDFEDKFKSIEAKIWQEWKDSNPRPAVLETAALPN